MLDSSPIWKVLTMLWNTVTLLSRWVFRFCYGGHLFHERYFLHFILSEDTVIKVVLLTSKAEWFYKWSRWCRPRQFCLLKKNVLPCCIMPIKCVVKFKVFYLLITYTFFMIPITLFTTTIWKANYQVCSRERMSLLNGKRNKA